MFFILPVGVDYRARRYPMVTFTLMGICTAVYILTLAIRLSQGREGLLWEVQNLWLIPGQPRWWTFLTSMFVHSGLLHLAGNMAYLFLFGSSVEDMIGRPRFVAFYLACGFAAEMAYIASGQYGAEIPMGGASGAISGCIGGFLVLFLKTRIQFKWIVFLLFRLFSGEFFLPAWLVISFWFLSDLFMMFNGDAGEHRGGVAFGAHIGGMLCGLALIPLERLFKRALPEDQEEVERSAPRLRPKAARPIVVEQPTIYLLSGGAQAGPFTPTQIQQMFETGAIGADDFYWREGLDDWRNVEELRAPGTT